MAGAIIAPALPQISEQFKTYPNVELLTKLLLSLPALSVAVTSQFLGYVIDKTGRKKLLLFSLILFAVSGTIAFWIDNLYYLLISRAILGIAISGLTTTSITLIGDYYSGEERKKFIGMQSSFMSLGGIFFLPLGGYLAHLDWRYPFLLYISGIVLLPFVYLVIKEPVASSKQTAILNNEEFDINKPVVGFVLFIAFVSMILFYMLPVQIPFLLKKELGVLDSRLQGYAIATGTTTGAIASYLYHWLKSKISFSYIYALAFLLQAIGYFVIGSSASYTTVILGMVIAGFAIGLMMPNANLWVVEISPLSHRGRMIGAVSSAGFLGLFLSPIVVSFFGDSFTLSQIFTMGGYAAIFLTIVCIFAHKKIK